MTTIEQARACSKARSQFIAQNMGLVRKVASRWARQNSAEWDDLLQAGMLGLNRAIDTYDQTLGSFGPHAYKAIFRDVGRESLANKHVIRVPTHANAAAWRVEKGKAKKGDERYAGAHRRRTASADAPLYADGEATLHDVLSADVSATDAVVDAQRKLEAIVSGLAADERNVRIWAMRMAGHTFRQSGGGTISTERVRQICAQVSALVARRLRVRDVARRHPVARVGQPRMTPGRESAYAELRDKVRAGATTGDIARERGTSCETARLLLHRAFRGHERPAPTRKPKIDHAAKRQEARAEREAYVARRVAEGATAKDVASELGVARATIVDLVTSARRGLPKERDRIAQMVAAGESVRNIADKLGRKYEATRVLVRRIQNAARI
jgi:RNA polymerase sigma factor (sigma-70 family)